MNGEVKGTVTGTLTFHCDEASDALVLVAGEIANRWRLLGWDVDRIRVQIVAPEDPPAA